MRNWRESNTGRNPAISWHHGMTVSSRPLDEEFPVRYHPGNYSGALLSAYDVDRIIDALQRAIRVVTRLAGSDFENPRRKVFIHGQPDSMVYSVPGHDLPIIMARGGQSAMLSIAEAEQMLFAFMAARQRCMELGNAHWPLAKQPVYAADAAHADVGLKTIVGDMKLGRRYLHDPVEDYDITDEVGDVVPAPAALPAGTHSDREA